MHQRLGFVVAAALVFLTATIAPAQAVEFLVSNTNRTFLGTTSITDMVSTGSSTFNKKAQASTAETNATFKVSDDATGKIEIGNGSDTDGVFAPLLSTTAASNTQGFTVRNYVTTDTGSGSCAFWDVRTVANGAIATRPLFTWANNNTTMLQMLPLNSGANAALSWGTQAFAAPTLTTRSTGTRLVYYNNISGAAADYATGLESGYLWNSVAQAINSAGFKWYGGTTNIATLRGDGFLYMAQAGGGFGVKEGTNATMGTATLVGGTATVSTTKVTASSRIFLTSQSDGGTPGFQRVSARTAGTSFTITSSSGTDTSTVAWVILEPAP